MYKLTGTPRVIAIADPPAGQGFVHAPAGAYSELLEAVSFQLVTAAGGGNRAPVLELLGFDGVPFLEAGSPFIQAGALTGQWTFAAGITEYGANGAARQGVPMPALLLDNTMSLELAVGAIAAGDRIHGIRLYVYQYATGGPDE